MQVLIFLIIDIIPCQIAFFSLPVDHIGLLKVVNKQVLLLYFKLNCVVLPVPILRNLDFSSSGLVQPVVEHLWRGPTNLLKLPHKGLCTQCEIIPLTILDEDPEELCEMLLNSRPYNMHDYLTFYKIVVFILDIRGMRSIFCAKRVYLKTIPHPFSEVFYLLHNVEFMQ